MQIIKDELAAIREKYADARRTEIDYMGGGDFAMEDMIEEEQVIVTISHQALIKRTPLAEYRQQGRGGVGMKGSGKRDEDYIEHMFVSSTPRLPAVFHRSRAMLLASRLRDTGRIAHGEGPVDPQPDPDRSGETASGPCSPCPKRSSRTRNSAKPLRRHGHPQRDWSRKRCWTHSSAPLRSGIIAISVVEGDELIEARLTDGNADIFLASSGGKAIRFNEKEARPMGRDTRGVKGISLRPNEEAIGMVAAENGEREILAISENGYGKRSHMGDYAPQGRGGMGRITLKTTDRVGPLVAIRDVASDDDLMIVTRTA